MIDHGDGPDGLRHSADGSVFHVSEMLAIGAVSTLHHCRLIEPRPADGLFKLARDPRTNPLIANEVQVLGRLHGADTAGRYTPFLPEVVASFPVNDGTSEAPRLATVLRNDPEIRSPDELYTLDEIHGHFPAGLNARHVAWIWRRLLTVLGFAHAHDVVHAAVLPEHVLVEPRGHKLVLIDWCCAVADWRTNHAPVAIVGGYRGWYARHAAIRKPPTPALDVGFGARCMIELLGGDPITGETTPPVEPAIGRHLRRCLQSKEQAWRLLEDFDRLIETLWGQRKFVVLDLPPKRRAENCSTCNTN